MARNRRHSRYRPAVARGCGIVLAATALALLVLPFSVELLAIAAIVAAMALAVWVREQARRGSQRAHAASAASSDHSLDYTYGSAFDGGAASAFSDAGDDTRGCRFDSAFDSSSSSFDSGGGGSGSSDCGGGFGGD